jgi:hypothetical protein
MTTIVLEHVNVRDLPEAWRAKLPTLQEAQVTVRIEEETKPQAEIAQANEADDLLFGMWRDREDMADVETYISKLREPRYHHDGSRNEH